MALVGLTFLIIILAVAAMSLGAVAGRAPIKGSCGGLACIKSLACDGCAKRINSGESK
jgi:uncharacterized protein